MTIFGMLGDLAALDVLAEIKEKTHLDVIHFCLLICPNKSVIKLGTANTTSSQLCTKLDW